MATHPFEAFAILPKQSISMNMLVQTEIITKLIFNGLLIGTAIRPNDASSECANEL